MGHVLRRSESGDPESRAPAVTAARLAVAKTWEPPQCPSADEGMDRVWPVRATGHCSALKNEGGSDTHSIETNLNEVILAK